MTIQSKTTFISTVFSNSHSGVYIPGFLPKSPGAYACLVHHVFEHIFKKLGWIEEEEDKEY